MNSDATLNPDPTSISVGPDSPIKPQPPVLHTVFIGKDGLRAGWSLLVFIAMVLAIASTVRFIVLKFHHPPAHGARAENSAKSTIINECVAFVAVLLVTWIMSKIERRPNGVYGLGGNRKLVHFFAGLGWGVVSLSLFVLALSKSGLLVIDRRLLYGRDILRYGGIWLIGFLTVGLLEEYFTRGFLQYTLTRGLDGLYSWIFKTRHSAAIGFWTSAVILSFFFGLGHSKNPGESSIGVLAAGLVAMVFCLSLWRTGSLWWAIGFHTAWDWAQSFLFGVADSGIMVEHRLLATHPVGRPLLSGGATGPEGSIFVVIVFGFISLIIFLTLPRARPIATLRRPTELRPGKAVVG